MKKSLLLGLGAVALSLGAGAAIGLNASKTVEADATYTAPTREWKQIFCTHIYLGSEGSTWNAAPYVNWWGSSIENSTWPGKAMVLNYTNGLGEGVYSLDIPADVTGFQFTDSTGSKQTVDIYASTLASSNAFYVQNSVDGSGHYNAGCYSNPTNVMYCLDAVNDLGPTHGHAWVYGDNGTNNGWNSNSALLHKVTGSNGLYYKEIYDSYNRAIFNKKDGDQTEDLNPTSLNGQCYVMLSSWSGTWISIEAAEFIDKCMHFNDVDISNEEVTANCATYYLAAKTAYNALSSNAVRLEVQSITAAKNRLKNWATANGSRLDESEGGTLSAAVIAPLALSQESTNTIAITVVAGIIAISSIGGFAILTRKKER